MKARPVFRWSSYSGRTQTSARPSVLVGEEIMNGPEFRPPRPRIAIQPDFASRVRIKIGRILIVTLIVMSNCSLAKVSAQEFTGELITGLDGVLYEPYQPKTIERVQVALKARGLYEGPVNGVLDAPTMRAIYAFQKATGYLQVCGVPTPRTRKVLEQGSHTDPSN